MNARAHQSLREQPGVPPGKDQVTPQRGTPGSLAQSPSRPPPTVPSREQRLLTAGGGLCRTQQSRERLLMQAGGWHRAGECAPAAPGGPEGRPAAAPGPARRRRPLTYRLHAGGRGQETVRGRGETKQRRTVRSRRLVTRGHHGQPHPPACPGGVSTRGSRHPDWGGRDACVRSRARGHARPAPRSRARPQDPHLPSPRWSASSAEAPAG